MNDATVSRRYALRTTTLRAPGIGLIAAAVADEFRRAGISPSFLPSVGAIRMWDIELAPAEAADVRVIAEPFGYADPAREMVPQ